MLPVGGTLRGTNVGKALELKNDRGDRRGELDDLLVVGEDDSLVVEVVVLAALLVDKGRRPAAALSTGLGEVVLEESALVEVERVEDEEEASALSELEVGELGVVVSLIIVDIATRCASSPGTKAIATKTILRIMSLMTIKNNDHNAKMFVVLNLDHRPRRLCRNMPGSTIAIRTS